LLSRDDLYRFQVSNFQFDAFIKLLLRSYTGIFSEYTTIDETLLAKRSNVDQDIVKQYLNKLSLLGVISYLPQKRTPMVIFFEERLEEKSIFISKENYQTRKIRYTERANAILQYAQARDKCRSQTLLEYFGEFNSPACDECDVCRMKNESLLKQEEFNLIRDEIMSVIALEPLSLEQLLSRVAVNRNKIIEVMQWLLDNHQLHFNEEQLLVIAKGKK
jgi:ATP-dependent DNA helicase RecQ